jgi:hypothetical protein
VHALLEEPSLSICCPQREEISTEQQQPRRRIPEHDNVHNQRSENFKSHVKYLSFALKRKQTLSV